MLINKTVITRSSRRSNPGLRLLRFARNDKFANVLLLLLFAVFPFGQILKIGNILFLDVIVGAIALFTLFTVKKYPKWYRYFAYFLIFALFSWIFNYFVIQNIFVLKSILYLVRLFAYSLIPVFVSNYYGKKTVVPKLLVVSMVIAIFGWLQYLFIPDLRAFKVLNWDDHYFRLVGTFLDPGFTAIILVLGAILALYKKKNLAFIFLSFTLLFTYSRAGYLALFVSLFYYFFKIKKLKLFFVLTVSCILYSVFFLPSGQGGEGVKLTRTSTISARLLNYKQSIKIIKISPVLGVGYNNICAVKLNLQAVSLRGVETTKQSGIKIATPAARNDIESHSCFGLDNSILFILATTGVIGFLILLYAISRMPYGIVLSTSALAVLVASFFANVLFYPHVMAWMGLILGLGGKVKVESG